MSRRCRRSATAWRSVAVCGSGNNSVRTPPLCLGRVHASTSTRSGVKSDPGGTFAISNSACSSGSENNCPSRVDRHVVHADQRSPGSNAIAGRSYARMVFDSEHPHGRMKIERAGIAHEASVSCGETPTPLREPLTHASCRPPEARCAGPAFRRAPSVVATAATPVVRASRKAAAGPPPRWPPRARPRWCSR